MDRILIIEDDLEQQSLIRQYVGMMGYEARADDGAGVLELLPEYEPSLILLNIYLETVPGMALMNQIRETRGFQDTPIIAMSAEHSEETVTVILSSGANDFLPKPLRFSELTPKIQHQIELYRSRQQLRRLNDKLEREKNILSRYFSMDFVEKVLSEEIEPRLGGSKMQASIMFFDLRNSTHIGEILDPETFSDMLSMVLTDVMDLVFGSGGSINKLTGDGVLATFGCPVSNGNDAYNALSCALRIREYMGIFNNSRPDYLTEPIGFGMGIATGRIFAGNVGSFRRMEYSVIGDVVNLAARLEGLNKEFGSDILCDEATLEAADRGAFRTSDAGLVQIRGKDHRVQTFLLHEKSESNGAVESVDPAADAEQA